MSDLDLEGKAKALKEVGKGLLKEIDRWAGYFFAAYFIAVFIAIAVTILSN